VPSGPGDDDLPTGLQIVGRRFDEHTAYRAGFAFEASREIV
jgi:amidase